jgi:GT2 family glycosyltransferase
LLDPKTFLYGEELILGEKISDKGWKACYYPHTWVIHAHAVTTRKFFSSDWKRVKMQLDSDLYYFKEYRRYNQILLTIVCLSQSIFSIAYLPLINMLKKMRTNSKFMAS